MAFLFAPILSLLLICNAWAQRPSEESMCDNLDVDFLEFSVEKSTMFFQESNRRKENNEQKSAAYLMKSAVDSIQSAYQQSSGYIFGCVNIFVDKEGRILPNLTIDDSDLSVLSGEQEIADRQYDHAFRSFHTAWMSRTGTIKEAITEYLKRKH